MARVMCSSMPAGACRMRAEEVTKKRHGQRGQPSRRPHTLRHRALAFRACEWVAPSTPGTRIRPHTGARRLPHPAPVHPRPPRSCPAVRAVPVRPPPASPARPVVAASTGSLPPCFVRQQVQRGADAVGTHRTHSVVEDLNDVLVRTRQYLHRHLRRPLRHQPHPNRCFPRPGPVLLLRQPGRLHRPAGLPPPLQVP